MAAAPAASKFFVACSRWPAFAAPAPHQVIQPNPQQDISTNPQEDITTDAQASTTGPNEWDE